MWQLIKRDPAWRFTIPVTIIFAALVVLWHFFAPHGTAAGSGLLWAEFLIPLAAVIIAAVVHQSDASFQSTLPVTVQQIFASQLIAISALMWVPVSSGIVILIALGDTSISVMPLRTWSLITCAALAFHCVIIRGLAKLGLPFLALFFAAPLSKPFPIPFGSPLTVNLVFGTLWLFCGALIWRTWRVIPKSFRFAPAATVSALQPVRTSDARTRGGEWKTLFLSASPAWGLGHLFVFLVITMGPRSVIAAAILPGTLALMGGYLLGVELRFLPRRAHHLDLRTQIMTVTFLAALSMTWNLGTMAAAWRPARWIAVFLLLAMTGAQILIMLQTPVDPLRRLASAFPVSLAGTLAVAVFVTGTLFLAMDQLFRRLVLL